MSTQAITPLRHRMIEDMNARKLCAGTQRGHIHSCKRFAVFLNRSPDTATTEDIRSNNRRRLERNRKFVDSPVEGDGFEPSIPRPQQALLSGPPLVAAKGRRRRSRHCRSARAANHSIEPGWGTV